LLGNIGFSSDLNFYSGTGFKFSSDYPAGPTSSLPIVLFKTNGQLNFAKYISSTSFTGTAAGYLAFTSTGDIITTAVPSTAYLPLTGGTLTGALIGTTGSFDGGAGTGLYSTVTSGYAVQGNSSSSGGTAIVGTSANGYAAQFLNNSSSFTTITVANNGSSNFVDFIKPGGTIASITNGGAFSGTSFVKTGGTSSQILAADGSVITAGTNITISGGTISSSGGGGITGSGTTNTVPKFSSTSNIGDSNITDSGTLVSIGLNTSITGTLQAGDASLTGTPSYGLTSTAIIAKSAGGVLDIRNIDTNVVTGNTAGTLQFSVKDDATPGYAVARIDVITSQNSGSGASGGGIIRFLTAGGGLAATTTEKMRITNAGAVCINTTTTSGKLNIDGDVYLLNMPSGAGTNALKYNTSTGIITYDTSSIRYKDNVRDSKYGLSDLMKLSSKMFEYKDSGRTDVGFIAEEVFEIIPEFVSNNKDGQPDSVAYDRITSLLVKAIQEQQVQIEELKAKLK
jgi:hypothetical protein